MGTDGGPKLAGPDKIPGKRGHRFPAEHRVDVQTENLWRHLHQ